MRTVRHDHANGEATCPIDVHPDSVYVGLSGAAQLAGVSTPTIYEWAKTGRLKSWDLFRIDRPQAPLRLYRVDQVQELAQKESR